MKMLVFKRFLALFIVVIACHFAPHFLAAQSVFADEKGVAIKGFDAVAYFTDKKPMEGKAEFVHEWNGAKWYFASADHRDLFKATPEKYAPQYGGFCAFGVCMKNKKFATDPKTAWRIVDEKLYFNYNPATQTMWEKGSLPQTIEQGNKNWTTLATTKK